MSDGRVPFKTDREEPDVVLTDAERLELAEHEWAAWKQIAHEYWLEIQHLRATPPQERSAP